MGRAWAWLSVLGAALAAIVLALQVTVPLTKRWGLVWPAEYYLAMGLSLKANVANPFFWSPWWEYELGTLTPLIAAGGLLAFVAGRRSLRAGARFSAIPMVIGECEFAIFVSGFALSVVWFKDGIPV